MTEFPSIVSLLFRGINCAILVAFGVYLYKKYLLAAIMAHTQEQEFFTQGLIEQTVALEYQENLLIKQQEKDKEMYTQLKNNVMRWREALAAQDLSRAQEYEILQKKIAASAEHITTYRTMLTAYGQVMPLVLTQVTEKLEAFYTDPAHDKEYTQKIIRSLTHRQES
jgi:hypothetical protein